MSEGEIVDPVTCPNCGHDHFNFIKEISNDTCIERTIRCVKCNHDRVDRACLKPAHVL